MPLHCDNNRINGSTPLNTNNTAALDSSSYIQQCSGATGTTGDEQSHVDPFESISQPTDVSEEGLPEQASTQTGIRSSRFTIFLIICGLQLPLVTTFAFGSDMFLDGTLRSLALLCMFCVMAMIQLLFIVLKRPITAFEIIVYLLLLAVALVVTSYTYHQQLVVGIDNLKNFILNIVGLSVSGTLVMYDMYIEYKKMST
jgi:hypothetical protein